MHKATSERLLQELKFLFDHGSRNAYIKRYYEIHKDQNLIFYREDFEKNLLTFMVPDSFAGQTISPTSLEKLKIIADNLFFKPEFKNRLNNLCKSSESDANQPHPNNIRVGVIPLPLADPGTDKGYIAEIEVFQGNGDYHPHIERAAVLIQKFCRRNKLPEFNLAPETFACTLIDPPRYNFTEIEGSSLDLPLLLALFSSLCKEPLPHDIAASAKLTPQGKLLPVGGIDEKIAALKSERYYVKRLFVAADQKYNTTTDLKICRINTVFEVIDKIFPRQCCKKIDLPLDVDKTLTLVEQEYRDQQWDICISNATALINSDTAKSKKSALFTAFSCRGAAHCHRGEITRSRNDFKAADKHYKGYSQLIDASEYFDMRNRAGVALKDVFRYREARKFHEENRQEFIRLRANAVIKAKNISSLSQLLSAQGEYSEAINLQKKALALLRQAGDDLARNYGYLADIQTRAGNFEQAKRALGQARKQPEGQRNEITTGKSVPFLDWYEAQLLYRKMKQPRSKRRYLLQKLKKLCDQYAEITFHAPAMVHKFTGLGELLCADPQADRRLEAVISFLSKERDSTYQLLAASVRIERQLILLAASNTATLAPDIETIIKHLQFQPDAKRSFDPQLTVLQRYCRKIDLDLKMENIVNGIIEALQELKSRIPY